LVEGIHLVGAAVEAGWPIEFLLYSQELLISEYGRSLVNEFGGHSEEVSAPVLASVCSKQNPQGLLAIAERRFVPLGTLEPMAIGAALASPQDPGNVGTVLRTLDAVGGSALCLLDGGADPFHPTAVRAAMGATFSVPIVKAGFDEFDSWRRACGLQLVGSSARGHTDYRQLNVSPPWILLLGSEQKGLSEVQQEACDVVVQIPMHGRASSLNLAVAAGILLYEYSVARE
jgi:TrmH family RNA methyltransferase